eukprot:TRINITY_DN15427_c0_g1_i1.p1 TRINITY_DN15427_c0_g1~~TRINITY_DN15427_c0_g1_i1.p1  ORF type:complete len:485 (+),score=145.27 TRINITY_DN15427_c0_g1_i1:23-1477(+)
MFENEFNLMNISEEYYIKNQEMENIFLIFNVNGNMICECSNIMFHARQCLICGRNQCISCVDELNRCANCNEETQYNEILSNKIKRLKCRCIYCKEEILIEETKEHPQRKEDHLKRCEGCGLIEMENLILLHQQECISFLSSENKLLKKHNTLLMGDNTILNKFNKRLNEDNQVLKGEYNVMSKRLKKLVLENEKESSKQQESTKNSFGNENIQTGKIKSLNDNNKRLLDEKLDLNERNNKLNKRLRQSVDDVNILKNEIESLKISSNNNENNNEPKRDVNYEKNLEMAVLSFKLYFGTECFPDEARARNLCVESSNNGNKFANGMRFYFGWDKKQDYQKSFEIFSEIVRDDKTFRNEETSYCLFLLALQFEYGEGTTKDIKTAIRLYKQAIKMHNSNAMCNLAIIYFEGIEGTKKDFGTSIKLLKKAVELNNSFAYFKLAGIYEDGRYDIEKNINLSIHLYKKAAELGCAKAKERLSILIKTF